MRQREREREIERERQRDRETEGETDRHRTPRSFLHTAAYTKIVSFTIFGYKNKFDPRRQNDTPYQEARKLLKFHNSLASDNLHCTGRISTK